MKIQRYSVHNTHNEDKKKPKQHNTTQETKKMSDTDLTKNRGEPMCSRRISNSYRKPTVLPVIGILTCRILPHTYQKEFSHGGYYTYFIVLAD